jgi:hypothetical protein
MKVREMDELVFLWKEYGKANNEELTRGAQHLKDQVREFVQSLPTFHETKMATIKEIIEYVKRADKRAILFFELRKKGISEKEARKKVFEEVPEQCI